MINIRRLILLICFLMEYYLCDKSINESSGFNIIIIVLIIIGSLAIIIFIVIIIIIHHSNNKKKGTVCEIKPYDNKPNFNLDDLKQDKLNIEEIEKKEDIDNKTLSIKLKDIKIEISKDLTNDHLFNTTEIQTHKSFEKMERHLNDLKSIGIEDACSYISFQKIKNDDAEANFKDAIKRLDSHEGDIIDIINSPCNNIKNSNIKINNINKEVSSTNDVIINNIVNYTESNKKEFFSCSKKSDSGYINNEECKSDSFSKISLEKIGSIDNSDMIENYFPEEIKFSE